MLDLNGILPPGKRWRELYLPELISDEAQAGAPTYTKMPSMIAGGHKMTLTGAQKRTTCDGVHFITGVATSNINCGGIHNADAKLVISFRFKLDQVFNSASPTDMTILGLYDGVGNDYVDIWLENSDGSLRFTHHEAAAELFTLTWAPPESGTPDYWAADTWYHVIASIGQATVGGAASDGARLRIDNGAAATNVDATAISVVGNFVLGCRDDGVAVGGITGVLADVYVMIDDVTDVEETDLYDGVPPSDAVNVWLLDEGRSVTAFDRGTGGNDGTLDSSCTWKFGTTKLVVLGLDGINDRATSAAGVDISGDFSVIWIAKMKTIYGDSNDHGMFHLELDATNYSYLAFVNALGYVSWTTVVGGATVHLNTGFSPSIDDYAIIAAVNDSGGNRSIYQNGVLLTSGAGVAFAGGGATIDIGRQAAAGTWYDVNKTLLFGLVGGALNAAEVFHLSRILNNQMHLGIGI